MKRPVLFALFYLCAHSLFSQQPTVGLLQQGLNDQPGYVVFAPIGYTKTYLIDKCGYEVHSWPSTTLGSGTNESKELKTFSIRPNPDNGNFVLDNLVSGQTTELIILDSITIFFTCAAVPLFIHNK